MILGLMGCLQAITGQPSEPLTMPSAVLKEANHEVLSNKPALKESQLITKTIIKTENLKWEDSRIQ